MAMASKTCIKDFEKDGLIFPKGTDYNVSLNPVDGRIYLYTPDGRYTDVSKKLLNEYFL